MAESRLKNADEAAVVAEAISGDVSSSTGAARRVPSGEDGGSTGLRCLGQVCEEEPSAGRREHQRPASRHEQEELPTLAKTPKLPSWAGCGVTRKLLAR